MGSNPTRYTELDGARFVDVLEWQTGELEVLVGRKPREGSTPSIDTPRWWKWQARRTQDPVPKGVRVRLPPWALSLARFA